MITGHPLLRYGVCHRAYVLYVMRLLLGAAEAGLYPGIIYYLTLWFGREERAKATGLFLLGSVWPILSARRWADCY